VLNRDADEAVFEAGRLERLERFRARLVVQITDDRGQLGVECVAGESLPRDLDHALGLSSAVRVDPLPLRLLLGERFGLLRSTNFGLKWLMNSVSGCPPGNATTTSRQSRE
jgi:hypothetical protein